MEVGSFVHLQVHSEYSLLDGAIRIPQLISTCKERGDTAVALTDNGNMFGAIDFYFGAKEQGLNPILGCEIYLTEDMSVKHKSSERLILLCQNYEGYQNLCHIVTEGHVHGFYYHPRVDIACLKAHSNGIVAISPGYWGPVAQHIQLHFLDKAKEIAQVLADIFPDRFYIGLQRTGELGADQLCADSLALARDINLPVVALNDVYFLNNDDGWMQDLLRCIKIGKEIDLDDQNNSKRSQHGFKTNEEMQALFSDIPEAIQNTVLIANQCDVEIVADQVLLPHFECPNNMAPEDYLEQLVWIGIEEKYEPVTKEIKDRVQFEMDIINKMQYPIYFLIIYDFLKYCTDQDIPVGPGRGSAAGSIVSYALNITRIDPIKYNLLFERFLNPERVSMPDIDIDFCIKRRGEVIEYISKKYGDDHVAQIVTFGTMAARGVVRDVGRALGVPLDVVDRLAKLIPSTPGHNMSIKEALEEVEDLANVYAADVQVKQLLDYGMKLEGFARHSSTHAAGVVISKDPLSTMVPLMNNDGQITTHYTMNVLEKMGLLKMDILGLRNLTVIRDACDLIHEHTPDLDIDTIPYDDKASYDVFCCGETVGVFQCESPGMRRLIVDLKPTTFEDIIAVLALYRPGPLGSGMVEDFISNKSGKTKVKYDLPQLEPILNHTYGMIVYQEQVMQIATEVGGFTLGESDMLRRAMGKKKKDVMDQMKDKFIAGAKKKKIKVEIADKIFELCYKFAEYGFNKSHSAAYAMVSYQTAYLKAHFPAEYIVALMRSMLGNTERTAIYLAEAKRLGLSIFSPNVNHSEYEHRLDLDEGIIYFGLGSIKAIGEQPVETLVTERKQNGPFLSVFDFFNRLKGKDVNKRVVEHLIKTGALDCLEKNRSRLVGCYEEIMEKMNISARHSNKDQVGLFETLDEDIYTDILNGNAFRDIPILELLRYEKEITGEYLTAHPLDEYASVWKEGIALGDLGPQFDKEVVEVTCVLSDVISRMTKKNRPFTRCEAGDFTGKVVVLAFDSPKYEEIQQKLKDDAIVRLTAKVKASASEVTLMVEDVTPISMQLGEKVCHIDILEDQSAQDLHQIKQACLLHHGQIPLYFHVNEQMVVASKSYWITDSAIPTIEAIIGEQKVWIEQ
jgi:DNA polymerase III subunit alpha